MQTGSYQFEKLESRNMEAAHLAERAQLRLAGFKELLLRHGFPEQGKILEIGAAHGIRTRLIAEYFPKTEVIGIDRSPELLQAAFAQEHAVKNLRFEFADIYELPFAEKSFDFIYARLVFMHLPDPLLALNNLKKILKPGARLLIEDADRDCMFFEPLPNNFQSFWQKVQAGQRKLGGDPNIGRKLASYLKETGFQQLQVEVQPIIGGGEDITFLVETLMPSLNLYLNAEDRMEGEKAINTLRDLSKDPRACFYHFWFAVSGQSNP